MQLHMNQMGLEKMRLLVWGSIYWININNDLETTVKIHPLDLNFIHHNQKQKQDNITQNSRQTKGSGVFMLPKKKNYFCFVDYQSKFPVVNQIVEMAADQLSVCISAFMHICYMHLDIYACRQMCMYICMFICRQTCKSLCMYV